MGWGRLMQNEVVIADACQYLIEPPDLWRKRVSARHRDKAPKVAPMPDGGEGWSFEDGAWVRPLGLEVAAGEVPVKDHGTAYATIEKAMYDPKERLKHRAGNEADVMSIFPTYGLEVRSIADPELHVECVRAYNDGVWEWAHEGDPKRLVPQAMIPAVGFDAAMAELRRVAKMGFRGIVFSGWPGGGELPELQEDPFWALCQEANIVVNLVRGGPAGPDRTPTAPRRYVGANGAGVRAQEAAFEIKMVQMASANAGNMHVFVAHGVLDRHPRLKLALIDTGSGWIACAREGMDWIYRYSYYLVEHKLKMRPSDYVQRQIKATVINERSAIEQRSDIGVGTLMWASAYPRSTSTWPRSMIAIKDLLVGVPEEERRRILGGNFLEVYGVAAGKVLGIR